MKHTQFKKDSYWIFLVKLKATFNPNSMSSIYDWENLPHFILLGEELPIEYA